MAGDGRLPAVLTGPAVYVVDGLVGVTFAASAGGEPIAEMVGTPADALDLAARLAKAAAMAIRGEE